MWSHPENPHSKIPLQSTSEAWWTGLWTTQFTCIPVKIHFQVHIITKTELINKLKQIYSENPLRFLKAEHPRARIELTQEVYIKEKPMLYTPEDIKEFSVQIKELLEKA